LIIFLLKECIGLGRDSRPFRFFIVKAKDTREVTPQTHTK